MHSAPTPGVLATDEDDSSEWLPRQSENNISRSLLSAPNWLLDPAFQDKKVLMEITGTLGAWHGGELEGAKGFVANVFRTPGDTLITIEYIDPGRAGTTVEVPINYLSPIRPERVGDHAIPLEGPAKGTEVILSQQLISGVWQVSKSLDSDNITCLENTMVKIHVK